MDTNACDRVTRLFDLSRTRRSALSALLGIAAMGTALGTAAAKPQPNGRGQSNGKGKRRKKRQRRVTAQAKNKPGNHCIAPSGVDLNVALGISDQIVAPTPPFEGCDKVGSGERWTVAGQLWAVAQSFEAVPEGFDPAGETPLEDFIAKFEAVKYVIDPGTKQEKAAVIPNSDALLVINPEEGFDLVSPTTLGTVKPLSVGDHAVDVYWVFRAMHCDGIGVDRQPGVNCFPAGETKFPSLPTVEFKVVPGHN
jgi:hypothetical protein